MFGFSKKNKRPDTDPIPEDRRIGLEKFLLKLQDLFGKDASPKEIKRPDTCPVAEDRRIFLEKTFLILLDLFGKDATQSRKVLVPHYSDFPITYNETDETAFDTLKIVAAQMEIPYEKIHLELFEESAKAIGTGRNSILLEKGSEPSGLYWGMGENDKYEVSLVRSKLQEPENMVAVLAHELAHIKLLGENRIEENDEYLTDLTTIFFGLGIFNANAAFQTFNKTDTHGWQKLGYLTQMEWGYALSLFAYIRGEKNPEWTEHLTLNIKGDFIQGQNFIDANEELIFKS